MLPVASPQHAVDYRSRDGYGGHPTFVEPIETALGMGDYQEIQEEFQQIQIDNHVDLMGYQSAAAPDHQPGMTVDLESFKHQKIQEFRQALEYELERKRQQAQKELENAERLKWEQLRNFQEALQGEVKQTSLPTQQYMSQTPPMNHQSPMYQTAMEPNSYMQQQQAGMLQPATPLHLQSMGNSSISVHQQAMPRTGSPMRQQQNMGSGRGSMEQRIMSRSESPMRQRADSPMRQQQSMGNGLGSMEQQNLSRPGSPIRQQGMIPVASPRNPTQQYTRGRSTTPMQSRLPPSSPYYNPTPSQSRMRSVSPQRPSMESSPNYRPPTTREMQAYFEQHHAGVRENIWRPRNQAVNFTFDQFDNEDTIDRTPGVYATRSAGVERSRGPQTPRERIHLSSTWNPPSPRRTGSPYRAQREERLEDVELLEKEYAKVTGKRSPSKATALLHVKKMQEARRQKLVALTARVVENRKRFAKELKFSDRPLEISFLGPSDETGADADERREDPHTSRIHRSSKRDSRKNRKTRGNKKGSHESRRHQSDKTGSIEFQNDERDPQNSPMDHSEVRDSRIEQLAVVQEAPETEEEEETGSTRDPLISSESERPVQSPQESEEEESSFEVEHSSLEKEQSSSEAGYDALDFLAIEKEIRSRKKHSTRERQSSPRRERSKSRQRKEEKKANDFVEKLRQKRSHSKEAPPSQDLPHTYSRDDVLASLEKGRKSVTLPMRDSKLARKNRKLSSQKLVDSSRSANKKGKERKSGTDFSLKIATKKSTLSNKPQREPGEDTEQAATTNNDFTGRLRQQDSTRLTTKGTPVTAAKTMNERRSSRKLYQDYATQKTRTKRNAHASSALSLISDLSESAYGAAHSYTGSGTDYADNGGDFSEEDNEDDVTETTTSGEIVDATNADGRFGTTSQEEPNSGKEKKIKVRELPTNSNSVSEGFEVEESSEMNSIYSRSALDHIAKSPEATEKAYKDTLKDLKALQALEKRLDEQDHSNFLPELMEAAAYQGWDINKVAKQFAAPLFPQIMRDVDGEEKALNSVLRHPEKAAHNHGSVSTHAPPQLPPSEQTELRKNSKQPDPPESSPATRRFTLTNSPDESDRKAQVSEGGWRSRVRGVAKSRRSSRAADNTDSIDMSDVRTSLKSLSSRRHARGARRGISYKPHLQSLDEQS